ncbi:MAG TPA: hypothetical protein VH092_20170 [Urbifossiella sp.]|nr:hypothetical protein [Urbifossiella sp.]
MEDSLDEPRRRELFVALVAAQDEGLGVRASRETIATRFSVDAEVVVEVEEEGLNRRWPPFGKG